MIKEILKNLDINEKVTLVINRPEVLDFINISELSDSNRLRILKADPSLHKRLSLSKIEPRRTVPLLMSFPMLKRHVDLSEINNSDWIRLARTNPEYFWEEYYARKKLFDAMELRLLFTGSNSETFRNFIIENDKDLTRWEKLWDTESGYSFNHLIKTDGRFKKPLTELFKEKSISDFKIHVNDIKELILLEVIPLSEDCLKLFGNPRLLDLMDRWVFTSFKHRANEESKRDISESELKDILREFTKMSMTDRKFFIRYSQVFILNLPELKINETDENFRLELLLAHPQLIDQMDISDFSIESWVKLIKRFPRFIRKLTLKTE